MSSVRKAVVTAAGRGTRMFPATATIQKEMLPLMDLDGLCKPAIQLIIEEAVRGGVEEVCVVVNPDNRDQIVRHFGPVAPQDRAQFAGKEWAQAQMASLEALSARLTFVVQEEPAGYGHAVWCAREFARDEPFLLMLGDHISTTAGPEPCSRQVISAFERHGGAVSAVQQTPAELLHLFGTVSGNRCADTPPTYSVTAIVEKPERDYAGSHLRVAGLVHDMYLCFFGMHVLPPDVFGILGRAVGARGPGSGEVQLTPAQEELRSSGTSYFAVEVVGERHDIGIPFGYAQTQAALALNSVYRDQMLASLVTDLAVPRASVPPAFREDP